MKCFGHAHSSDSTSCALVTMVTVAVIEAGHMVHTLAFQLHCQEGGHHCQEVSTVGVLSLTVLVPVVVVVEERPALQPTP